MATTTNKQKLLSQFFALLKKGCEVAEPEARPVLEQFVYGILREGATHQQADRAYKSLLASFFDWNEVRVSTPREVEEIMDDLPDAASKSERIVSFLQEVFEATFSFDLEPLHKKGVKQAAKTLSRYQAADDYICSWVVQQSLGGHAIPLDAPTLRVVRRFGLSEAEGEDLEVLRTSLEHLIPKAKGPAFTDLASHVGHEHCWDEEPSCASCPLAGECATALESGTASAAVTRTARAKPR